MLEGRTLLIATMHGKEHIIAPIMEKELGVQCELAQNLNTDVLGTFSGEIDRKNDALTTLRNKCLLAQKNTKYDLVIANEGTFGPHPNLFFIPADEEIIMLKDFKNNTEIIESQISTETNLNGAKIKTFNELEEFIASAKFPEHAVILRSSKDNFQNISKGIHEYDDLIRKFNTYIAQFGEVYIETDMRAMHNPSRMKVIEEVTHKLIKKIKSVCPECQYPGIGITEATKGLLCSQCLRPTNSYISFAYQCQKCSYKHVKMYPQKQFEDPMYCNFCNP
jgi:hypothetical protein